jgi:asparagine synthase (glutamine-hydrolysing)
MCGISIIIDRSNSKINQSLLQSVNDKVAHRGPDDSGFHHGSNFAFGHRRLSILDLSQAGHQPMQRNHLCITYNGEIYNYIELREELIGLGYSFNSTSDTEVILAAYEQWGVDAFTKFNGMWAFAIHDSLKNEIILSRDHFGIKPLYFSKTTNYFLAGSEIKQFTAVPEFQPVLNKAIAVNFLVRGWLNYSNESFFEGVHELRPGHYLRYNLITHQSGINQWYNLAKASVPVHDSYIDAVGKVRALFIDSVRIRMRSDVRVGSCLSGGIDSSSIVSITHSQKMGNEDFATITSCYTDKRYDEQKFSDEITKQTGFRAVKVFPDLNHLLDEGHLDKMIYHQDQPFSGASHYAEFKVFQTAREQNMIVMQDGQGADEYLCGYGEFFIARIKELLKTFRWHEVIRLLKYRAYQRKTSFVQEAGSFVRTAYQGRLIGLLKRVLGRSDYPWLTERWRMIANSSLVNFSEDSIRSLSIEEIQHSSIPYQLHSEDRNSMMFSIESRLPFLDHRLVEYCIGLPSAYKIKNGYTKAVLRDAITELPEVIRNRTDKMGFVAPDPSWVIQNKEMVRRDLENIIQSSSIFSPAILSRFDRFVKGELGYEPIYFRAMAFSRFCKIFKMKTD